MLIRFTLINYVVLEHDILVSPMEQLIKGCGGMQRQRIKKGIKGNSLFHCLEGSVGAYDNELEDCGSKTFHKVPDLLGSPQLDVKKTSDALLSPD